MTSPIYDQKVSAAIWYNFLRVLKGHCDQNADLMLFCDLESGNIYWAITICQVLFQGLSHMLSKKKKNQPQQTLYTNPTFTCAY